MYLKPVSQSLDPPASPRLMVATIGEDCQQPWPFFGIYGIVAMILGL